MKATQSVLTKLIASFVFATLTVISVDAGTSFVLDRHIDSFNETGTLLFEILVILIPFLIFIFFETKSSIVWVTGALLTIMLWSYYAYEIVQSAYAGTGANIGLGLFILISPIVITGMSYISGRILQFRNSGDTITNSGDGSSP